MSAALLLLGCTALLIPSWQRFGIIHPLTITLALWTVVGLLFVLRPFNLEQPSLRVTSALLLGLAALSLPALLLDKRAESRTGRGAADRRPVQMQVRLVPLTVAVVVVAAAVIWGTLQYRAEVSAVLGMPFDQVDTKLIRWAELYGDLSLSAPGGLAQSLGPLLGVLGIVGGLYHRWWWYALVPVAVYASMQSPSRTGTLTVAVTCVFFFLLMSRSRNASLGRQSGGSASRVATIAVFTVVGALGLVYFGTTAQDLDKSELPAGLEVAEWMPAESIQPLLYQVGGVSAFTAALDETEGTASPYGDTGRSVYGLVKVVQGLGFDVPTPAPFATYVDMPIPFNTYTAFGDAYFDWGLAGVVGVFLLLGLVLHLVGTWPSRGHPVSVWAMSLMGSVLTATPIHMRLLDIDILMPGLVGCVVLSLVLRPVRGAEAPGATTVPTESADEGSGKRPAGSPVAV
ncbi:oligosaccharide repeat unit polymerase [Blastococcus sp. URHD0036]|uniref:oligosaccharide repeat unit polymerase n=1 Tax=Blastococcus sp. URHD0036 TaxID=1380356 RepID=UPI000495CC43|nr:oligosaccharide repeat unit polymerase [Blastococcus sp. URHD0036]